MKYFRKIKYVDIGKQRFSKGKYYCITQLEPIDITKRHKRFVKRVSRLQFYISMYKALIKEAIT